MNYLERNAEIIAEIRAQDGQIPFYGPVLAESSRTNFRLTGSFESATLGQTVCTGVKEGKDSSHRSYRTEQRFIEELAVIAKIAKRFPYLVDELPLFFGLVRFESNFVGILTEDYSKGGILPVAQANTYTNLPFELHDLIVDTPMDVDGLQHMVLYALESRRLGDFDGLWSSLSIREMEKNLPIPTIKKTIPACTIEVNEWFTE